jgi:DNA-directed RNA polymerase specialized sigma24 family protein
MSVANCMLDSVTDAEGAVMDAFLRLQTADEFKSPEGFLFKTTVRHGIDQLRGCR